MDPRRIPCGRLCGGGPSARAVPAGSHAMWLRVPFDRSSAPATENRIPFERLEGRAHAARVFAARRAAEEEARAQLEAAARLTEQERVARLDAEERSRQLLQEEVARIAASETA